MLSRTKNINCEQEAKFIQDRISGVERTLTELCQVFGGYSRKAARLRDKGDEISKVTLNYSESEEINKSLSNGLAKFANTISTISDYGDLRAQKIDEKVINEFQQYEGICKNVKSELKQIFNVRQREMLRKRQLDRTRERNPRNRQQIVQAETELVQATAEVSRTMVNLEEQITTFERQKLHDVKAILLDFISTEMGYHAKALEHLTIAYQDVSAIDEETDLEEFKKSLRLPDTIPHATSRRSIFRSSQSMGSLGSLFSAAKKKSPGIPKTVQKKSRPTKNWKSEEALDKVNDHKKSIYNEAEESDASESEEDPSSDKSETKSEDSEPKHVSPFISKRYLKSQQI